MVSCFILNSYDLLNLFLRAGTWFKKFIENAIFGEGKDQYKMADSKTIKPVLIKMARLMTISTGYKKLIRK